jgi:hypothetical protein
MIRLLLHPLPTLSRQQVVYLSQPSCASPAERGARGLGKEPNSTTARKAWSSVNHSILSALTRHPPPPPWSKVTLPRVEVRWLILYVILLEVTKGFLVALDDPFMEWPLNVWHVHAFG